MGTRLKAGFIVGPVHGLADCCLYCKVKQLWSTSTLRRIEPAHGQTLSAWWFLWNIGQFSIRLGIMNQALDYFLYSGLKPQPARCGSLWIVEYFTPVAAYQKNIITLTAPFSSPNFFWGPLQRNLGSAPGFPTCTTSCNSGRGALCHGLVICSWATHG